MPWPLSSRTRPLDCANAYKLSEWWKAVLGYMEGDPDLPERRGVPTRKGTWQQVNNVERRWRQIRQDTGLDWVTPHTFRKTVATLISERVNAETASQQFGHSSPAITREFYISKPAIAADVAHVLEELAEGDPGEGSNTSGISGEQSPRVQIQNRLRSNVSAGQSRFGRSG